MRIAWFTPFGLTSAIGTFSRHVTDRLSASADVTVWVGDSEPVQPTALPIVRYGDYPEVLDGLGDLDLLVFNFGNYLPWHGPIHEVARAAPGVAILHDRVLHHMFATRWLEGSDPAPNTYLDRLEHYYGRAAARHARAAMLGDAPPPWEVDEVVVAQPLYEEAIVNAEGVVTHSGAHAAEARERWLGPVTDLQLPCYDDVLAHGAAAQPAEPRADGRLRALVVGHVNPNKRLDRLVELLAADPWLAERLHIDVVGSDAHRSYVDQIRGLLAEHSETVSVELHGSVGDEELRRRLGQADIFINLRHPTFESSSASLMEQLAHGRPVVVFDTGFFAEVPGEAVARVPPGDYEACGRMLRCLVADPELRASIGREARRVAEACSVERYADGFLEFVDEVRRCRPAIRVINRAGMELGVMGFDERAGIFDRIGELFGPVLERVCAGSPDSGEEHALAFRELATEDLDAFRRFLTANDVDSVTATFDPFLMRAETADGILAERSRDGYYGAFAADGAMVALSMLRGWDEGYETPSFGIAVDHSHHGRGLGTRLTAWTIEQARARGAPDVRLTVYDDNPAAESIYQRLGFAEVERRTAGERKQIVMRLGLVRP